MASSLCAAQGLTQTRCTRDGSSEPNTDSHGPGPTCAVQSANETGLKVHGQLCVLYKGSHRHGAPATAAASQTQTPMAQVRPKYTKGTNASVPRCFKHGACPLST
eukprot:1137726-Pelagomonas_calceolata.AAC.2